MDCGQLLNVKQNHIVFIQTQYQNLNKQRIIKFVKLTLPKNLYGVFKYCSHEFEYWLLYTLPATNQNLLFYIPSTHWQIIIITLRCEWMLLFRKYLGTMYRMKWHSLVKLTRQYRLYTTLSPILSKHFLFIFLVCRFKLHSQVGSSLWS